MTTPLDDSNPAQRSHSPRVAWVVDLLAIAAFVAFVCSPMFMGASISAAPFLSDLLKLAQPTLVYSGERLRQGELPLWNPYWSAGYPHVAMPSASVFYPTTILYGLVPFPVALNIIVLLHLYLAGAFSYCLGRRTVGGRGPGLYLAFAVVAGDLMLPMVAPGHPWSLQTLAWFPLVLLFVYNACLHLRWRYLAGISVASALMHLGGDPQSAAFALFYTGAFVVARLGADILLRQVAPAVALTRAMAVGAAVVLGAALAAIQLVPSQELLAESVRAQGLTYESFSGYIGTRWGLVRAWITDAENAGVLAAGRLSIAAAVVGLCFSRNRTSLSAALAALPCALYAFAPGWLFEALIRHLPVYGGIRGGARMVLMLYWTVAFLGAFGVRAWIERQDHQKGRSAALLVVAFTVLGVGACVPWALGAPLKAPQFAVVVSTAFVLSLAWAFRNRANALAAAGAVLALAFMIEQRIKISDADILGDPASYALNANYTAFSRQRDGIDRVEVFAGRQTNPHLSAIGTLTQDRTLWGYHALYLTRYARLLDEVGGMQLAPRDDAGRLVTTNEASTGWLTPAMLPLLDLFNVRYLVRLDKELVFQKLGPNQSRRFVASADDGAKILENTSALPPAFPIHRITVCKTDDEALTLLREAKIDYRTEATVTGAFDAASVAHATRPEPVMITRYEPERIAATADLDAPGVIVFSEMYYPGWRAYVDGAPREVLAVDAAFRGVYAAAGQHTVELRYEPRSLVIGMRISAAAFVLLLAISIAAGVRSRRATVTPA